jgi:hypothetical protein
MPAAGKIEEPPRVIAAVRRQKLAEAAVRDRRSREPLESAGDAATADRSIQHRRHVVQHQTSVHVHCTAFSADGQAPRLECAAGLQPKTDALML